MALFFASNSLSLMSVSSGKELKNGTNTILFEEFCQQKQKDPFNILHESFLVYLENILYCRIYIIWSKFYFPGMQVGSSWFSFHQHWASSKFVVELLSCTQSSAWWLSNLIQYKYCKDPLWSSNLRKFAFAATLKSYFDLICAQKSKQSSGAIE